MCSANRRIERARYAVVAIVAACILQGAYMLFDGIHKLITQRYFGQRLGPWATLVRAAGIDPESMAPVFVVLGCLWLCAAAALVMKFTWRRPLLIVLACISLAYVPFGTVLSLLVLVLLLTGAG